MAVCEFEGLLPSIAPTHTHMKIRKSWAKYEGAYADRASRYQKEFEKDKVNLNF